MGDLIGACNSSHSGKGLISKGAGLTFLSGLRFRSTGGGSQSTTGTGLRGGVLGLDRKPMWAGGGTCMPKEEKSNVPGVMGT